MHTRTSARLQTCSRLILLQTGPWLLVLKHSFSKNKAGKFRVSKNSSGLAAQLSSLFFSSFLSAMWGSCRWWTVKMLSWSFSRLSIRTAVKLPPHFLPFFKSCPLLPFYDTFISPLYGPPPHHHHLFFSSPHLPASMEALMSEIKYSAEMRMKRRAEPREILHPHGQSHRFRGSEGINHLRPQTSMQQKKNGKSSCKTIPNVRSAVVLQSSTRGRHIRHLHFSYIGNIICQIKAEWIYWKGFFNNLC